MWGQGMGRGVLLVATILVIMLGVGVGEEDIHPAKIGDHFDDLCGLARVEKGLGRDEEAIKWLARAIVMMPNVTVAWYEIALILGAGGPLNAVTADRCLGTAHRIDPGFIDSTKLRRELRARGGFPPEKPYVDLGDESVNSKMSAEERSAREHQARYKRRLFERYYTLEASVKRHLQVLQENPRNFHGLTAAGRLYTELQEHHKAADMYRRAARLHPDDGGLFVQLVDSQVKGCVFSGWDSNFERLAEIVVAQVRRGEEPSLGPIPSTIYPLRPQVSLAICRFLGDQAQHAVDSSPLPPLPVHFSPPPKGMLTIGYVTSHFTSSSIGREMLFLIGSHDPSRFRVQCYALNKDDGSWLQHTWRQAISKACHEFVDASGASDRQTAERINQGGVTVLMDLNGWSGGVRSGVIAERPAPVQVNYKNWVASSGMPNLHFVIGDAVATPPEFQSDFTEGLVLVPNSYFVSGHRFQYPLNNPIQAAAEVTGTPSARSKQRQAHGLPSGGFLMGNFNNLDKLEPRVWDMWRRIVDAFPGVSLWLQKYPPTKAARIAQLAEEEVGGEFAKRLVLTPFFKSDHHISIKALGDVFVDNPTYNAHSTAMDTLWGGLPLATLPEEKFSARVGASLLMAIGKGGETIARDLGDLETIVSALIRHPERAREARGRLERARSTAPLFDTVRAVRNLEKAVRCMFEAAMQGDRPAGRRMHVTTVDAAGGGSRELALERKLHGLRVETSSAEAVSS